MSQIIFFSTLLYVDEFKMGRNRSQMMKGVNNTGANITLCTVLKIMQNLRHFSSELHGLHGSHFPRKTSSWCLMIHVIKTGQLIKILRNPLDEKLRNRNNNYRRKLTRRKSTAIIIGNSWFFH